MEINKNEDLSVNLKNSYKFNYAVYGKKSGVVVLFNHGWPGSRLQAKIVEQDCKKSGVELYGLERPGYGNSQRIKGRSFFDWADMMEDFCKKKNFEKVFVVGLSGGTPYSLAFCQKYPKRVAACAIVSGAIPIVDFSYSKGLHFVYKFLLICYKFLPLGIFYFIFKWVFKFTKIFSKLPLFRKLIFDSNKSDDVIFLNKKRWKLLDRDIQEAIKKGFDASFDDALNYAKCWNIDFSKIKSPVHYWHGTLDMMIPHWMAEKTAQRLLKAKFTSCKNQGHFSAMTENFSKILNNLINTK